MSEIAHIDHPAAAAFRLTAREVESLLNEHDQLRQSYEFVCKERDEARAQATELAEQVDELRTENSRLRASVGALCAEVTAEGEAHAQTIAREMCLAPTNRLGLRPAPGARASSVEDRLVPFYGDTGRV